jgi:hypothetical protein
VTVRNIDCGEKSIRSALEASSTIDYTEKKRVGKAFPNKQCIQCASIERVCSASRRMEQDYGIIKMHLWLEINVVLG